MCRAMVGIGQVNGLVIDGTDTHVLAAFWSAVLGTSVDSVEGDGHYIDLAPTDGFPSRCGSNGCPSRSR